MIHALTEDGGVFFIGGLRLLRLNNFDDHCRFLIGHFNPPKHAN